MASGTTHVDDSEGYCIFAFLGSACAAIYFLGRALLLWLSVIHIAATEVNSVGIGDSLLIGGIAAFFAVIFFILLD